MYVGTVCPRLETHCIQGRMIKLWSMQFVFTESHCPNSHVWSSAFSYVSQSGLATGECQPGVKMHVVKQVPVIPGWLWHAVLPGTQPAVSQPGKISSRRISSRRGDCEKGLLHQHGMRKGYTCKGHNHFQRCDSVPVILRGRQHYGLAQACQVLPACSQY